MELTIDDYLKQTSQPEKFCHQVSEIEPCIAFLNEEVKKFNIYDQQLMLFSPVEQNRSDERIIGDINLIFRVFEQIKRQILQQDQLDGEVVRLRQNLQLKNQQFTDTVQQHEKEMRDLVQVISQMQSKEKSLQNQLSEATAALQRQGSAYDAIVRKMDISDKTLRRVTQESEELQHRLSQALRKEAAPAVPVRNVRNDLLEQAVRTLYRDIYQMELEKHPNADLNRAALAEAVVHVQQTYNQDMEQMAQANDALTRRVAELEGRLVKK